MSNTVALDALIGGLLTGGFSHMTRSNYDSVNYIKIIGFVYAAPCVYFYLFYILSKDSKTSMNDFMVHALMGTLMSATLLMITLFFRNESTNVLIIANLVSLVSILLFYFYFRIYEII